MNQWKKNRRKCFVRVLGVLLSRYIECRVIKYIKRQRGLHYNYSTNVEAKINEIFSNFFDYYVFFLTYTGFTFERLPVSFLNIYSSTLINSVSLHGNTIW